MSNCDRAERTWMSEAEQCMQCLPRISSAKHLKSANICYEISLETVRGRYQ